MSRISIVMCGSNEDYGGNFIARMQACLDSIFTGVRKYGMDADLLLVDWGTPPDREGLWEAVSWSKCRMSARVLVVPKKVVEEIPNPYNIKFLEPWAKSVGVRRVEGDFILTTNADSIYSDELLEDLSKRDFDSGCVYRVNRHDRNSSGHVYQINRPNGSFVPGETFIGVSRTGAPYREDMPHFNGAGEFILMSRENYHAIRGWPELPYWAHVDGMVLWAALKRGLRQVVLSGALYHQDHAHGRHNYSPKWRDADPWTVENGEDWGFRGSVFETFEISVKRGWA